MRYLNAWRIAAAAALLFVIASLLLTGPRVAPGPRDAYVVRLTELPQLPITMTRATAPSNAVVIQPGQSIQAAVDARPEGTAFLLKSGVHRMQSIVPKDGDSFYGEAGTVLNGSRVLTGFEREGGLWVVKNVMEEGQVAGFCAGGYAACQFPEDLFMHDVVLRRVSRRLDVGPGRWYLDHTLHRLYLYDDPRDARVELSATRNAFSGKAKDVAIRGLVIEKYAQPGQFGAIQGHEGTKWRIEGNEVRFNHAAGVVLGTESVLKGNFLHHNGQLGVKGGGHWTVIEGNVIAYNNVAGFDAGWEAGGGKFSHTSRLVLKNNVVANNYGTGLWTDIDNIYVFIEDNVVADNSLRGIFHEISYEAVIRNNRLSGNGLGFDTWLWGGQIVIANSRDADVYGNDITVPAEGGDGITLVQSNRGEGKYGLRVTANNYVHDNDIRYLGRSGQSGAAADYDERGMLAANNRFDRNRYYVVDSSARLWNWMGELDWQAFRAKGQEAQGSVTVVAGSERVAAKP